MINVKPTDKLVFDLEMLQIDYNEEKKESLKKEISEKYNVPLKNIEINFVPITVKEDGSKVTLTSEIVNNIQDPKFQQKLFLEYLNTKEITDISIDDIIDIDNKVNSYIDFDAYSKYKPYKIKYLKWDNYLSYGKGNFIDFSKLNGLVLLTGQPENTSGKTTLAIDLLRFALFGKADKSPTLDSVFNTFLEKETEVMVEACIQIDNDDYVIRRTINRPTLKKRTSKSKAKQKVEYFKLLNGSYESIENCEGESGTQTNQIIKDAIGNIEDFDLVISATSYTLGDLLRMGQTDKGKLFSKWLGLLTLEQKEEIAKELFKVEKIHMFSNQYNRLTLESEKNDMKTVIEDDKKQIVLNENNLNELVKNIDIINSDKKEVIVKRKEIKDELVKVDVTTIEYHIKRLTEELQRLRSQMSVKKERYTQIKDVKFNIEEYNKKISEERSIDLEQAELRTKINTLREDNKRIEKLTENKVCPTCGHEIDLVEQNNFIEKNNNKINEFVKLGVENKSKLEKIKTEISSMEEMRNEENELNRIKLEMSAIKVQIDNTKLKIKEYLRQQEEIEQNKENIRYNNEIDAKIRILDEKLNIETKNKENLIKQIENSKNEISIYNKEIEKREKLIAKIIEEEKTIRNWNVYQELIGKNGIVKIVLKRALPIVNNEISRLINDLCDFNVILSIDENNKVCLDLIRDGKKMDLGIAASGWEGCISSIALRCALGNISCLPKPNFCTYDEVMGGISSQNVENIMKLFRRVLNNYDFIIHICHDTAFIDYHDRVITVSKKDNISTFELK